MDLNRKTYKTELEGDEASLEISDLAGQANAAVLGRHGETAVLATVVIGKKDQDSDFFPLSVDYEERFYAVGKIMGSRFMRRESRPSDEATLSARLIDRTIRPLFDHRTRKAVQVTITILAYDEKHDPDTISLLAASTALSISDIPWNGPVAGVSFISEKEGGELEYNAFFSGPKDKINMIELEGNEVLEDKLADLFDKSQKEVNRLIEFQEQITKEIGKAKIKIEFPEPSEEIKKLTTELVRSKAESALQNKAVSELEKELAEKLEQADESKDSIKAAMNFFEEEMEKFVKDTVLKSKKRPDGRALDEIRPLYAETDIIKRTHGSALFIRGTTQILAITTLAPPNGEQLIESMKFSGTKRFLLHYNFLKFSTGETGRSRGPGRREIGHGALAAKALNALIPPKDEFPYTIRVVAETLSSNGSSSMATVCATSLALMAAGVKIREHVAGISIGLISVPDGSWETITDIQGVEDHYGDMDFKVAGTTKGINAIQVDVKINGINKKIFIKALEQARKARLEILETLNKTIPSPKEETSPYAPVILTTLVPVEKIGEVIGPGGKTINGIINTVGGETTIDIDDDGRVYVSSSSKEKAEKALGLVKQTVREYEVGEMVEGMVAKLLEFGAIVEFDGGQSGMIHVSELSDGYVKDVKDVVKEGDRVKAKIIKMERGKIGLTLKGVEQ